MQPNTQTSAESLGCELSCCNLVALDGTCALIVETLQLMKRDIYRSSKADAPLEVAEFASQILEP